MFGRSITAPTIGKLTRGWGKWYGRLPVPGNASLDLIIEIDRDEAIDPFIHRACLFSERFTDLQKEFAAELFDAYAFYKQTDLLSPT
jgi:hypothetical protein